jgi:hypothetical protein
MRYSGGCLCGAVRYEADAEPLRQFVCHCTRCQRHTGSAFLTAIAFPRGSVRVQGALKTYTEPGGTSREPFHRQFCQDCGTPILLERQGAPRTVIAAGTLDDRSLFQPTTNLFCDFAQDWIVIPREMENLRGYNA